MSHGRQGKNPRGSNSGNAKRNRGHVRARVCPTCSRLVHPVNGSTDLQRHKDKLGEKCPGP